MSDFDLIEKFQEWEEIERRAEKGELVNILFIFLNMKTIYIVTELWTWFSFYGT